MIQWQNLEKITEELEDGKKIYLVDLWHNPDVRIVVNLVKSSRVQVGKVFLGNFDQYNQENDQSFEGKFKNLQKKYELLQKRYREKSNIISKIKRLLDCD